VLWDATGKVEEIRRASNIDKGMAGIPNRWWWSVLARLVHPREFRHPWQSVLAGLGDAGSRGY